MQLPPPGDMRGDGQAQHQKPPPPLFPDLSPLTSGCTLPVPLTGNLHADCVTVTPAHICTPRGDTGDDWFLAWPLEPACPELTHQLCGFLAT